MKRISLLALILSSLACSLQLNTEQPPTSVATPALTAAAPMTASPLTVPPTKTVQPPIRVLFVFHMDPIINGKTPQQIFTRDFQTAMENLKWLRGFINSLPQGKRPRVTLEIGGDAAELFLGDSAALELAKGYYADGHELASHFHNFKSDGTKFGWDEVPMPVARDPCKAPEQMQDSKDSVSSWDTNVQWIDKWVTAVTGVSDAAKVRALNTSAMSFLPQRFDQKGAMMQKDNFSVMTGGRNECFIGFLGHDVYTPWRAAGTGPLDEDLKASFITIPSAPVLGAIQNHFGIPQDTSLASMQRRFMVEYLERGYATQEKIWVIGFHEHRYDINDPALGAGRKSSQREDVQAFISWLNTNFPNDIEYTTATQTRDIFYAWEKKYPNTAAFSYAPRGADWGKYPYALKGLARKLSDAHYVKAINVANAQVHEMITCGEVGNGSNWTEDQNGVGQCKNPKTVYLLWSSSPVTVDLSAAISGAVTITDGITGATSNADAKAITIRNPIVVEK